MLKYLLKNEKHFECLKDAIIKENGRAYMAKFYNEEPKEFPVIAMVEPYDFTLDSHCSPATMYSVSYVYLSDFEDKNMIFQPTTKLNKKLRK